MHAAYSDAFASLRKVNSKGMLWTLVVQPLLPEWIRKGDPNPTGLYEGTHEPLLLVSFTVNWDESKDDDFVKATTRSALEHMDAYAAANKTGHRYRYANYCAEWQNPFDSYGEENLRLLREVSRKYDPAGLFQRGCAGGFKLGLMDGNA